MAENAKMILNWTPSPDATSQEVQRSSNSSGPWATIATLGATINTYVDDTVDPTPFTTYYYRIETICTGGYTAGTSPVPDVCQNCPTEGNTFIFGAQNLDTNTIRVEWTSGTNKWINTNHTPSPLLGTTPAVPVGPPSSNASKLLFCAECGEDVDISWQPTEFGTPPGSPSNSEFSYMEQQGHISSYLPTSPSGLGGNANFNLGTVTRKYENAGAGAPIAGRFLLGVGTPSSTTFTPWLGKYVSANSNVSMSGVPSGNYWNFGQMPSNNNVNNGGFTQIRIDRRIFNFSNSTIGVSQKTALQSVGSDNNTYMSIIAWANVGSGSNGQTAYNNGHLRCEHYIYKLTRKTAYDTTDSVGFSMTYFSNVVHNDYSIFTGAVTHGNKFLPYAYNDQPECYLKIFTL
jgi:hypothetical protein